MKKSRFVMVCIVLLGSALSIPRLEAQSTMPQGIIEAAGSVGLSTGLGSVDRFTDIAGVIGDVSRLSGGTVTFDPGSNTKWNIGASGGYAVRTNLMVVGEFVRTRLLDPTLRLNVPLVPTLGFDASLIEATGGIEYQVPLRDSRVAPFAGVAVGMARSRLSLQESAFNILDLDFSDNHFTVNFGGGARIYLSNRWGIRPEFKIAHIPGENWVRTSVGLFYQFGK